MFCFQLVFFFVVVVDNFFRLFMLNNFTRDFINWLLFFVLIFICLFIRLCLIINSYAYFICQTYQEAFQCQWLLWNMYITRVSSSKDNVNWNTKKNHSTDYSSSNYLSLWSFLLSGKMSIILLLLLCHIPFLFSSKMICVWHTSTTVIFLSTHTSEMFFKKKSLLVCMCFFLFFRPLLVNKKNNQF